MAKNDIALLDGILDQRMAEGYPSRNADEVFEYLPSRSPKGLRFLTRGGRERTGRWSRCALRKNLPLFDLPTALGKIIGCDFHGGPKWGPRITEPKKRTGSPLSSSDRSRMCLLCG